MRQYISFGTQAGIGNRIKRLFSGLRLQADENEEIEMYWSLADYVTEPFGELFEFQSNYKLREIITDKKIVLEDAEDIAEGNAFRLLVPDAELPPHFTQAYYKDRPEEEYIDFEYERIPENVRKLYKGFFSQLKPSNRVLERMQTLTLPNQYISVHIRLNNVWKEWNRGKDDDIVRFKVEMEKYPEQTIFYLACCDEEVSEFMRSSFPGRIFELPNKDYRGSIDAVADLYFLAGGAEMIGSYGSTFTELAWWLSGCSQKVKIVGELSDWNKQETKTEIKKGTSLIARICRKIRQLREGD